MPQKLDTILHILQTRDGLDASKAQDLIEEAREAVAEGMDPEEACEEFFGLEPDYVWELLK